MAGKMGMVLTSETREDSTFTTSGVMAPTAKKLLKKIDKHSKSNRHLYCGKNAETALEEKAKKGFELQCKRFEELNEEKIIVTERIFRVAYMCAKKNLSFLCHPEIITCHQLNNTDMETLLYSPVTCQNIIVHISSELKKVLVKHILSSTHFSIMVDESTTVYTKCSLIVYVRLFFDNHSDTQLLSRPHGN